MMISAKEKIKQSVFLKYLILTLIQILVFEIFAPRLEKINNCIPSFLFPFSSISDGNINLFDLVKDFIILPKNIL